MSKKFCFKGPFDKKYGQWAQTLLKSERQQLYNIYWSLWKQLSWKKSLLLIRKILRLVVNTLTADDKYAFLNKGNLTQPIDMQLCQ